MKNSLVMVTTVVALVSLASIKAVGPAAADDCRSSTSASISAPRTAGGSEDHLISQACARAVTRWTQLVKARYGSRFASWSRSKDRSKSIRREGRHLICVIRATPCAPTVRAPSR